jgi:predicted nucleotidyltransferase
MMEYKITHDLLQNDLLVETLHALADCYQQLHTELFVVGATARDIGMLLLQESGAPRKTLDLDVAVLLQDWSQYEQLTQVLLANHFEKQAAKQRFIYRGENGRNFYEVDIVPFGAIADNEMVAWPPEGSPVMSVRCFADVMQHADRVIVDEMFAFRIASLSGQFLIKLDAWNDRHFTTKKDAADMYYILQNVFTAYVTSRPSLSTMIDIEATTFDVVVAGAEWIADDLRSILSTEHRAYYAQLLADEIAKEEGSLLVDNMLDYAGTTQYELIRRALRRMAEILRS